MATTYKGNTAVRETHESGKITREILDTMEIVKKGKYADLLAAQPAKGVELVTGYTVVTSTLSRARGGMGDLIIHLVEKDNSIQFLPVGASSSVIETEMAQVEKPIMTNKKLVASDSQDVPDEVEAWRNSPQQRRRNYQIPRDDLTGEANPKLDSDWSDLTGESLKVAQKIAKGIECWLAFYPVVTRTSVYKSRPDPSDIGKISSPPVLLPGSWVYLKTCDRVLQNSKKQYTRTEQWTGSDSWDTDLYAS